MEKIQTSDSTCQLLKEGKSRTLFVRDIPHHVLVKHLAAAERNEVIICNANKGPIAFAEVEHIFYLNYDVSFETLEESVVHSRKFALDRLEALKILYFEWCENTKTRVISEGWFKNQKFVAYTKEIGWGSNYVLFLKNINLLTLNGGGVTYEFTT